MFPFDDVILKGASSDADAIALLAYPNLPAFNMDKYRLKRKEKNESREEIFYQMKVVFLLRSVVGSFFCKSARCP